MGIFRRLEILEKESVDNYCKLGDQIAQRAVSSQIVECDKCGCLLYQLKAFKGEGEIRTKRVWTYWGGFTDEEYIHYPYYCKIHTKKEK